MYYEAKTTDQSMKDCYDSWLPGGINDRKGDTILELALCMVLRSRAMDRKLMFSCCEG